jgi:hypothetical protein
MKKRLLKPGFEFMFSAGIVAAISLPQLLFAQDRKEVEKEVSIVIRNNDTTFNGKNLKKMSADEKHEALAEINKTVKPHGLQRVEIKTRKSIDVTGPDGIKTVYTYNDLDSAGHYLGKLPDIDLRFDRTFNERLNTESRPLRISNLRRVNAQTFDFNNVGKDGMTTHISYRVTDAGAEEIKKINGTAINNLELQDLTLTPQFTAGKTVLSFTLPTKTPADVQLTDSDGKTLWKDKAVMANFSKTFTWGINGVYYLLVKQGSNTVVKRIVKE